MGFSFRKWKRTEEPDEGNLHVRICGESAGQPVLLPGSRPLAAQFVFKGHRLPKFSVLAEFFVHLPTATEFGVMQKRRVTT